MQDLHKIVLATGNAGKIKEFETFFKVLGISCVSQKEFDTPECEEPFSTFLENSLCKARHASEHTGLPALADDSGLIVDALMGQPGVLSARYATLFDQEKSDANNNQCLLNELRGQSHRRAAFFTVLVLVRHANDPAPIIAQAFWPGEILDLPKGDYGFGYDSLFWVPGLQKSAAELTPEEKNKYSHRGQAMKKLMEQIKNF